MTWEWEQVLEFEWSGKAPLRRHLDQDLRLRKVNHVEYEKKAKGTADVEAVGRSIGPPVALKTAPAVALWASGRGAPGDADDRLNVEGEGKEAFSFGSWVGGALICWGEEGGEGDGRFFFFFLRKQQFLLCTFWIEDIFKKLKWRC